MPTHPLTADAHRLAQLQRIKETPGRVTVDETVMLIEWIEELLDEVQRVRALATSRAGRVPR